MRMKNKFQKKNGKYPKKATAPTKLCGDELKGLIVAHFGAYVEVEDADGNIVRCHVRKNFKATATGDYVLWRYQHDSGIVVDLLPRKSVLERPETSHRNKLIAANVDVIVIVLAPPPIFSPHLLDRYLVAAHALKIKPLIVLNKIDLLDEAEFVKMQEMLSVYEKIEYTLIYSSTLLENRLQDLKAQLADKIGVLVGVSGVGKSSIIASLTQDTHIVIGKSANETGKHTTTASRLYHLDNGGALIDSPGVREFALWHLPKDQILAGFIEFASFSHSCKFRNCRHQSEPGCALQEALRNHLICEARWVSYQQILKSLGED